MMKHCIACWGVLLSALLFVNFHAEAGNEKVIIEGAKGKLAAVIQKPDLVKGQKVPMVIIMHGFGGNMKADLLTAIADRLEKQGIASIRFDFNGHGESEGEFQEMTVPNEIEDAKNVYNYVKKLPYVGKIALAGHSQGGVVASMTAGILGKRKISDVILMAPAAVLRDDAIRGNTFGKSYDPLDPPSYVELFGKTRLGRDYITSAFSLAIYETAEEYQGPACIIHGTGDRLVPYTYGERYHSIWKKSELVILDRADHGFSKEIDKVADIAVAHLIKKLK